MDNEDFKYLPEEWKHAILRRRAGFLEPIATEYKTVEERIVFYYFLFGNQRSVVRFLRTSFHRVVETLREFHRSHVIPTPKARGAPKKTFAEIVLLVEHLINSDHSLSIERIRKELAVAHGQFLSFGSVQKILHQLRFEWKPPKIRQSLKEFQIHDRLRFAFTMIERLLYLMPIIFSDESRFALTSDGRWIWRRRGDVDDSVFSDRTKFPVSVMVWGAIGPGFKSKLVFCDNSVTQSEYIDILSRSQLFEEADARWGKGAYLFQQDGATCHTARRTRQWLSTRVKRLANWPSNSPDLNVIEHIWGIMKAKLRAIGPKTKDEMKDCLLQIWDEISLETISKLCASLRYRLWLLVSHGGASIGPFLRHGHSEECVVFPSPGEVPLYEDMVIGLNSQDPASQEEAEESLDRPLSAAEDRQLVELYHQFGGKRRAIAARMWRRLERVKDRWRQIRGRINFQFDPVPSAGVATDRA